MMPVSEAYFHHTSVHDRLGTTEYGTAGDGETESILGICHTAMDGGMKVKIEQEEDSALQTLHTVTPEQAENSNKRRRINVKQEAMVKSEILHAENTPTTFAALIGIDGKKCLKTGRLNDSFLGGIKVVGKIMKSPFTEEDLIIGQRVLNMRDVEKLTYTEITERLRVEGLGEWTHRRLARRYDIAKSKSVSWTDQENRILSKVMEEVDKEMERVRWDKVSAKLADAGLQKPPQACKAQAKQAGILPVKPVGRTVSFRPSNSLSSKPCVEESSSLGGEDDEEN